MSAHNPRRRALRKDAAVVKNRLAEMLVPKDARVLAVVYHRNDELAVRSDLSPKALAGVLAALAARATAATAPPGVIADVRSEPESTGDLAASSKPGDEVVG